MAQCSDEIGNWYDEQRRRADALSEELAKAIQEGASEQKIKELRRRLEAARYVGD